MERRRNPTWLIVGATIGYLLVAVVVVGAVLIGTRGGDDGAAPPPSLGTTTTIGDREAPSATEDRLASLESGGGALTMVEQHQAMMDRMRVNAPPAMIELNEQRPDVADDALG